MLCHEQMLRNSWFSNRCGTAHLMQELQALVSINKVSTGHANHPGQPQLHGATSSQLGNAGLQHHLRHQTIRLTSLASLLALPGSVGVPLSDAYPLIRCCTMQHMHHAWFWTWPHKHTNNHAA